MAADAEAAEPALASADEAPPCELLSLIGETSRAVTFLGEQTWPVRRLVAFKLFKADVHCPPDLARDVMVPSHPIITAVAETGRIGDRPYVVTPYIGGGTLPQCYDRHRRGLAVRLAALMTIAEALIRAHAQGTAHGHLVPANVLCDPCAPFVAHIVDFTCNAGKARETAPDGLIQDDVQRLVELAELVLQGPFTEGPGVPRAREKLRAARSADDVHHALRQLQTRTDL